MRKRRSVLFWLVIGLVPAASEPSRAGDPDWSATTAAALSASPPLSPLSLWAAAAAAPERVDQGQVPHWSADDMAFFLHGTMSTEVVPQRVLQAFRGTYPDLFPGEDLSCFGFIADPAVGLPIGVSRRAVPHLGGLESLGINCAACHVAEVSAPNGGPAVRILGVTSHLDIEAFLGAVVAATFQTATPEHMRRFLTNYLNACEPEAPAATKELLAAELKKQGDAIVSAIAAEAVATRGAPAGTLFELDPADLLLNRSALEKSGNMVPRVRVLLKLFHNMRAALHVPDEPPAQAPPRSGPGRNNAFGLLSFALFGVPTRYGPVKYGVAWDLSDRTWVHWDGNTRSPLIRNLAASLGLGAPLVGKRGMLDFAAVKRQTDLSEQIRAPRYPFAVDAKLAERGAGLYQAHCASCHDVPRADEDHRLYALDEVGTDSNRAKLFDARQAEFYNRFFAEIEIPGYSAPTEPPVRTTQKYVASRLAGVWARSPYLHNGSVRTLWDLLTPPASRPRTFHRGTGMYDAAKLGYADDGPYVLDTTTDGNGNSGHNYGTDLSDEQKRELIEFLKAR